MYKFNTEEEFLNPDWTDTSRVHNWRNYVSDRVRQIWHTFTDEQKIALGEQAAEQSSKEEWD